MLCCGYTLTGFPISISLTSLALWQSNDCPSASKATLMNMDKYFMWIHYERLHNHNKAKHNKTVCIFLGIYCTAKYRKKSGNFNASAHVAVQRGWKYQTCQHCSQVFYMIAAMSLVLIWFENKLKYVCAKHLYTVRNIFSWRYHPVIHIQVNSSSTLLHLKPSNPKALCCLC